MDESAVRKIVEGNIERLAQAIGVNHWRISVTYGPCSDPDWQAQCNRAGGDYWRADLTFDPAKLDDEDEVMRSLVHELLHLVLAPFDHYRDAITTHIRPGTVEGDQEQILWTHAVEQTVTLLERTLANDLRSLPEEDADAEVP